MGVCSIAGLGYKQRVQNIVNELNKEAHELNVLLIRERHYKGLDESKDYECKRLDENTREFVITEIGISMNLRVRDMEKRGIAWQRHDYLWQNKQGLYYENLVLKSISYCGITRQHARGRNSRACLDGFLYCQSIDNHKF